LIELSKKLYLQDNPNRQRIPKGFADIYLEIQAFDRGSLSSTLALMSKTDSSFSTHSTLTINEYSYFQKSHDLIVDCIEFQNDALPNGFPRELLAHFNQFGRSLKDDESIFLSRSDSSKTVSLTQQSRKRLILTLNQDYECEVEFFGSILRANADLQNFILKLEDDSQISIPFPENYKDKLNDFFNSNKNLIYVTGVGSFDNTDK
jgi:hypothetical protein